VTTRNKTLEWVVLGLLVALFVWDALLPAWRSLNTDFPNYYLAARLARDGYPLDRIYDWVWFQRQKDHLGIDWGVVSYGPITPFSALVVAPFAKLSPLAAKRAWVVVNVLLLAATIALVRAMSRLSTRRIGIVTFLAIVPLRTCFAFGQQYVLVLFLLAFAGWLFSSRREASAAAVLAVGSVLKLYPALFLLFFLLKRRWRAAAVFGVTVAALVVLGAAVLGTEVFRAYATGVLPRALAGEINDPYYLGGNSVTVLLRRLFVAQPELNPHPLANATFVYVLLQPFIQALILASAAWVMRPGRLARGSDTLAWGAFAVLPLVLSTATSTYHFCALILSTALGIDFLLREGRAKGALVLGILHALICLPLNRFVPADPTGWSVFLGIPRLYALLGYWGFFLWMLTRSPAPVVTRAQHVKLVVAFAALVLVAAVRNARHFAGLSDSSGHLPLKGTDLVANAPAVGVEGVYFSRLDGEGYVLDKVAGRIAMGSSPGVDLFHPAVAPGIERDWGWVEVSSRKSRIARFPLDGSLIRPETLPVDVDEAEQPAISPDGRWLAFLREDRGRGALWVADRRARGLGQREVLDAKHDVLDFAFFPDGRIVLAAGEGADVRLFACSPAAGPVVVLATPGGGRSRYPAISPDGRWLAYSRYNGGDWQLQVAELETGVERTLTHSDCNSISPAWELDSKRVVYATDCGRGVGDTTLARISAVP
jgi:hypothetical protein